MSLWTAAQGFRLPWSQVMLFSGCVAYLNRAFSDTELVTDNHGLHIADALGWQFTSYTTALENFIEPAFSHIWMLGKIEAQRIQKREHAHIDLDLALLAPFPDRILKARVAVQSKDVPEYYSQGPQRAYMKVCGIAEYTPSFNTAILLWNDLALRDLYCAEVLRLVREHGAKEKDGSLVSIILEQAFFGHIMREQRVRVEECVPIPTYLQTEDFVDTKFVHFWGAAKRNAEWLAKFAKHFQADFPEAYQRAERGYAKLKALSVRGIL